jgi:hypothetical protein
MPEEGERSGLDPDEIGNSARLLLLGDASVRYAHLCSAQQKGAEGKLLPKV